MTVYKKKYYLWALGCQMNQSDGERIAAVLEYLDYEETEREDEADLIMVVACSVRQSAIDRIHGKTKRWLEWKKQRPLLLALSGCVLPGDKPQFAKVFDLLFNIPEMEKLPQLIAEQMKETEDVIPSSSYFKIEPKVKSPFSAWVPIMTGCNQRCTYCAVPYTRGKELSRPASQIIQEIQGYLDRGYKELTILGQTIDAYINPEKDQPVRNFADLLSVIAELDGDFWLRFMTSHPNFMTPSVLRAIASHEKIPQYIHLPAQSGNNDILRTMNRKYTREHYLHVIKNIRSILPNAALSTDFIVGFCGETQEQFQDTLTLYETVQYDMAYTAQYSPRVGTAAASWTDSVPKTEKVQREKVLNALVKKYSFQQNKKIVGQTMRVLIEKKTTSSYFGKTATSKNVKVFSNHLLSVGSFVDVKMTHAQDFGLVGQS
jgi:tRNA-2-methylthio-N6-dimethylallyladenosine synthase